MNISNLEHITLEPRTTIGEIYHLVSGGTVSTSAFAHTGPGTASAVASASASGHRIRASVRTRANSRERRYVTVSRALAMGYAANDSDRSFSIDRSLTISVDAPRHSFTLTI